MDFHALKHGLTSKYLLENVQSQTIDVRDNYPMNTKKCTNKNFEFFNDSQIANIK